MEPTFGSDTVFVQPVEKTEPIIVMNNFAALKHVTEQK